MSLRAKQGCCPHSSNLASAASAAAAAALYHRTSKSVPRSRSKSLVHALPTPSVHLEPLALMCDGIGSTSPWPISVCIAGFEKIHLSYRKCRSHRGRHGREGCCRSTRSRHRTLQPPRAFVGHSLPYPTELCSTVVAQMSVGAGRARGDSSARALRGWANVLAWACEYGQGAVGKGKTGSASLVKGEEGGRTRVATSAQQHRAHRPTSSL